jgi:hypothetical protein
MLRLITVILLTCCGIKTSLAQDIVHINDMSFLKSYFGHVVSKVSIKTSNPFQR